MSRIEIKYYKNQMPGTSTVEAIFLSRQLTKRSGEKETACVVFIDLEI